MEPADDQELRTGSYNSALARKSLVLVPFAPPTIRTVPFPRRVAVWASRAVVMAGAAVQVLVDGSYSSALLNQPLLLPPAIRTLPLPSSVAVWPLRPVAMEPADDQMLLIGSYNSALARLFPKPLPPPTTSTLPLARR